MASVLALNGVNSYYGASHILHGVSLEVRGGQVTCLLGLNGMGKTTTLRAVMGLVDRVEGAIAIDGAALDGKPHQRARRGVTLVPEDRRVFPSLTVAENLRVAARPPRAGRGFDLEAVYATYPRLRERAGQRAGTLSGGEQQMLAIGRALIANPLFLLLDEPSEGLAPAIVGVIRDSILAAGAEGIGVLLVEQSLALALAVGDDFVVLQNGQVVDRATRADLGGDPARLERHLTLD